jgi:hypothetical protein
MIGEQNLNYIIKGNSGLGRDEAYGLFVIFNSTLCDRFLARLLQLA